jgi:hypothetical protein
MIPSIIYSGPTKEKRVSGHGYERLTHVFETDVGRLSAREIAELRGCRQEDIRRKIDNSPGFPVDLNEDRRKICKFLPKLDKAGLLPERKKRALEILNQPLGTWEAQQCK